MNSLQKLVCRKCFPNNVSFKNWVYILPKWAKITLGKLKFCPYSYKFCEHIFLVFEKELGGGNSRCLNIKFEAFIHQSEIKLLKNALYLYSVWLILILKLCFQCKSQQNLGKSWTDMYFCLLNVEWTKPLHSCTLIWNAVNISQFVWFSLNIKCK